MYFEVKEPIGVYHDAAVAFAYKGILVKKEVGRIGMSICVSTNTYRIEHFMVRESERNKGIGRCLLSEMIKIVKKSGGTILIVYPSSEPYDGECYIENRKLYEIYEHLGFVLDDAEADRNKVNHKMIMQIK